MSESLSLIDWVVVFGIAVIAPLAIGGSLRWWLLCAAAVGWSFLLPVGWAGWLVLPFLAYAAIMLVGSVGALRLVASDLVRALARAYAVVAAGALAGSRFGLELFGIGEPIVELTAVHYLYAGVAALTLAEAAWQGATGRGRWRGVAFAGVVATGAAPPIVALGFVTGAALPQVGGAVLMTAGVWLTASVQLRRAVAVWGSHPWPALLLAVSGLAVWAPMVLAVAWAAGQHWSVPILSIPDMARTHGLANALAFVLCGLVAVRWLASSAPLGTADAHGHPARVVDDRLAGR